VLYGIEHQYNADIWFQLDNDWNYFIAKSAKISVFKHSECANLWFQFPSEPWHSR